MNGFRITLLVMLGLAIGVLLWIVTVFQPGQETNYDVYQAAREDRQESPQPAVQDEVSPGSEDAPQAPQTLADIEKQQQQRIDMAEEATVLAMAARKDADKLADEADKVANSDEALGFVESYDQNWNVLVINPTSSAPLPAGTVIAIRREGTILCEAEIDGQDEQSGQFTASIRQTQFNNGSAGIEAERFTPARGDQIILTPFQSSRELLTTPGNSLFPAVTPAPRTSGGNPVPEEIIEDSIPEVDATLTPVP